MGIPSAFLMGVSAICVRQQRQFRVRNDPVQWDVDTVQYSLFHFGVNKFISGVNMYNLSVIVQPGCEPSYTCEQDNPVWFTFYSIHHTLLVWTHKYGMMVPCWCDTRCMVWCTTYGVNKMSMVWWEIRMVWLNTSQFDHTWWVGNILPVGVIKHQMVWSNKCVEINKCSHHKWCDSIIFRCD